MADISYIGPSQPAPGAASFNLGYTPITPLSASAPARPKAAPAPSQPAAPAAVAGILAQHDPAFDSFWAGMVPRESGGQDVPNYRYDPTHTASGTAQITDTNWKAIAPRLGIDTTKFPTAMSAPADYQKAVAKLMYRMHGATPWDASHSDPNAAKLESIYSQAADQMRQEQTDALKALKNIDADAPDFEKQVRDATTRANQASDALMRMATQPPEPPANQALGHFGSLATIIGMAAGLLARQPLMGALSGATGAMEGANQNDWAKYKAGLDTWKTQSEMLLRISEMQQQKLQDIVSDHRQALADRMARTNAFLRANQMGSMATLLEAKGPEAVMKANEALLKATAEAQYRLQSLSARLEAPLNRWTVVQDTDGTNYRYNPVTYQATTLTGQPYTPKGGAAKVTSGSAVAANFADSDIDYWANVVRNGGALPPGISRTAGGSQVVQKIMKKISDEGGNPGDYIANLGQVKADQHSLLNMTKMADAATSFERTAKENFGLALRLAPKGIPTDWGPWLNKWVEQGETAYGGTDVPPYVAALLTAANEYAKIMSGSTGAQGSTVDSRREAAELFSPYLARGQIERVVGIAEADMSNRKQSLYGQVDDIQKRLREAGSKETTAQKMQESGDRMPLPAAFAHDPDGTGYRKDGAVWIKRGDELVEVPGAVETK